MRFSINSCARVALGMLTLTMLSDAALGGGVITSYTNRATWQAGAPKATPGQTNGDTVDYMDCGGLDRGPYLISGTANAFFPNGNGTTTIDGTGYLRVLLESTVNSTTLTFDAPITALGFDLSPWCNGGNCAASNSLGAIVSFDIDGVPSGTYDLPLTDVTEFRGWVSAIPFTSFTITTSDPNAWHGIDNLEAYADVARGPIVIDVPCDAPTIQAGINAALAGDTVQVSPGTYNELVNLLGRAITVRSTDPLDPAVVATTIIDGSGLGDSVVKCISDEDSSTVLDGFTITGGNAAVGGGMLIESIAGGPDVRHCVFTGNHASNGGGMFLQGAAVSFSESRASGAYFYELNGCEFRANTADEGAGLFLGPNSSLVLTNSLFIGNIAVNWGGGMAVSPSATAYILNCTFSENSAPAGGGLFFIDFSGVSEIGNSIFWNNGADKIANLAPIGAVVGVYNSIVQGGLPPTIALDFGGNSAADPMFVNPPGSDFRLAPGSPAIDAGDSTALSFYTSATEDLDDNPRYVDDPATTDTGFPDGGGLVVDMGAYEFQPPCPADFTGPMNGPPDGTVGILDFLGVLAQWGCTGACTADITGPMDGPPDGLVGILDFLKILADWGACP